MTVTISATGYATLCLILTQKRLRSVWSCVIGNRCFETAGWS
jgi:hypothetical protein